MSLKFRLALVLVVLMTALVASYSGLLFSEVRERADSETRGALPWVVALLPAEIAPSAGGAEKARSDLVDLMHKLSGIRHVRISLFDDAGRLLASAPSSRQRVPSWLEREVVVSDAVRKDVRYAGIGIAHFEIEPATSDELAELWGDFLRSSLLVVGLSSIAVTLTVWFTFSALRPVDQIRNALRAVGSGTANARLPRFGSPEMDEISQSFNRMASAIESAQHDRAALMRRLVESDEQARRRLAHDLHDELSPYLVALQPLTRLLELRCAAMPALADMAGSVRTLGAHQSHILATLREILVGLHPPEIATLGLAAALEQSLAQRASVGMRPIQVKLQIRGDLDECGATMAVSIYRMVQECVTNAQRHSDAPRMRIVIAVDAEPHAAERWLRIDAVNACPRTLPAAGRSTGLGTHGMRERCIALGGSFESGRDGGDWKVRIRLPMEITTDMERTA